MPNKFLINCNANIMCAIDIETTGNKPGIHDIIQIAVLPLNSDLEPNTNIIPFYASIQPKRPENYDSKSSKINREKLCNAQVRGLDPYQAADLFDDWFKKLDLGYEKRIIPLAHNWPSDYGFIIDWLGHESVSQYFDSRYRDTQSVAAFLNDVAELHVEQFPHPKMFLSYLASIYRVPHERAHDALQDCIITAQVYKTIIKKCFYYPGNGGDIRNIPKEDVNFTEEMNQVQKENKR